MKGELAAFQANRNFYRNRNIKAIAGYVAVGAATIIALWCTFTFLVRVSNSKSKYAGIASIGTPFGVTSPLWVICSMHFLPRISTQREDESALAKLVEKDTKLQQHRTAEIGKMKEELKLYQAATADHYSDEAFAAMIQILHLKDLQGLENKSKREQIWLGNQASLVVGQRRLQRVIDALEKRSV